LGRHPLFRAYLAFASVSIFWGTTYLGIRMSLESFSPLALLSLRFVSSGVILVTVGWLRGWRWPRGRELLETSFQGVLMLGMGNGCLVLAETWIPSGMAAVFITLSPFWLLGMDAVTGGERLHLPVLGGCAAAFVGVMLLMGPDAWNLSAGANLWKGLLILQLGNIFWNAGSLMQRRRSTEVTAFASGAVQQLASGVCFLIPALATGAFHGAQPALRSVAAVGWLVVFGSIVGYTSYIYALERLPVALVALYNYINPVVAMALGWWFYREPFGRRETLGMIIIFAGVALVRHLHRKK